MPPFLDAVKHKTAPESPERQHKAKKNKQSSGKQPMGREKPEAPLSPRIEKNLLKPKRSSQMFISSFQAHSS